MHHQLLATDVVDELLWLVHPILPGRGKRLSDDCSQASAFQLERSRATPSSVLANRYARRRGADRLVRMTEA